MSGGGTLQLDPPSGREAKGSVALHHAPEVRKWLGTPTRTDWPLMTLHVSSAPLTLLCRLVELVRYAIRSKIIDA
jgi:hypothetical protein